MDTNQIQEQIFRAIDIITDEKIKNLKFNQCVEVIINSDAINDDGSYTVLYRDMILTAFPQGSVTYKKGEVAYMLLVNGDLSNKKILVSGKSLKSDTVVAEHTHNDIYYTKPEVDNKSRSYTHVQTTSSSIWTVNHNLDKFPGGVTIVDSGGSLVMGEVTYNNANQITLTFSAPFTGKAYIN